MSGGVSELGGMKIIKKKKEWFNFMAGLCLAILIIFSVCNIFLLSKINDTNNNLKLQQDLNILKNNDLALARNQGFVLDSIGNNQLCGNGVFIPDSNRINEVPRGIVYSCFIQEVE